MSHTMYIIFARFLCIPSLPIRESFRCTSFGGPAGDSSCWGRPGWSLRDKTVGLDCIRRGCVWDCWGVPEEQGLPCYSMGFAVLVAGRV